MGLAREWQANSPGVPCLKKKIGMEAGDKTTLWGSKDVKTSERKDWQNVAFEKTW